jgi:exportin-1
MAQKVLTQYQEHADAWMRVDTILEYSKNQNTKYFALQILENVIKYKWKILPREQVRGWRIQGLTVSAMELRITL